MEDTHPAFQLLIDKKLANMSLSEKAQRFANLQNAARTLVLSSIKTRHPKISDEELKFRFAAVTLGAEFTKRYYGWDPQVEGY